ncbi:MAG TPA: tRNA (adenosine(37)-N6)-threonylcarbamoyltransferase complex dimerization subunit type 1 TsaB [Phenylobacterium sp.]|nr:tRNA (adenosine(37)-N6)-threonylcarbamoyltransferase complex dimerization subunit type 1 TsaB [Phenylobacterium sp.]
MIVLGLDTCLVACSVAVIEGDRVLASASEAMARGHQERLAPMVEAVMGEARLSFTALQRLGVTVGPGSFTGLRVGLAFAKGMAQALAIPACGIGTLQALAVGVEGLSFAVVDARRGQVYVQAFEDGRPLMAPDALGLDTAAARLAEVAMGRPLSLVGPGAALLAAAAPQARLIALEGADARQVARLAARGEPGPLAPLYLRTPDAKLPAMAHP